MSHPLVEGHNPRQRATAEKNLQQTRVILEHLHKKLKKSIDAAIYKELERIAACSNIDFTVPRSATHLARIACSIYFVRRRLERESLLFPSKDHCHVRLIPAWLQFSFGTKQVVGILAHAYLKNRYVAFDEESVLFLIKRCISEAELIVGSSYTFQAPGSNVKSLYFEIDKQSGLPFSKDELCRLNALLKKEIRFGLEQLVPHLFIARNEEDTFRNVLNLSREIHSPDDLPQVMILFDKQTFQEVVFTIILVRPSKPDQPSLAELFSKLRSDFVYKQERCQIVDCVEQETRPEANIFKLSFPKDYSLYRDDLSLNFYLARQRICTILQAALGPFRDFNGGVITKQREKLSAFEEEFVGTPLQNSDLQETFFYSLSPLDIQVTISMELLTALFNLFLEALKAELVHPADFFFKAEKQGGQLLVMVRSSENSIKEAIDAVFADLHLLPYSMITSQARQTLGYAISNPPDLLEEALQHALNGWQRRLSDKQVLKLAIEDSAISLDPRIGGDQLSSTIIKMLFEGLMREGPDGKLEYGIASTVEISPDFKTYLFKLRSAQWSDGSFVSAFDFEYTWKKILSPSFHTSFAYLFYPIKNAKLAKAGDAAPETIGVKAINHTTLQVDLEFPTPYFLELTAHAVSSPVNRTVDQLNSSWAHGEKGTFVCNGAFQLNQNRKQVGYDLIKNPCYWDTENVHLTRATFTKVGKNQAAEMFLHRNNDWVGVPLGTSSLGFHLHEEAEPVDFPNHLVAWYAINTQQFPFNNRKLRQALACSIDRARLQAVTGRQAAFSLLPPSHSHLKDSPLAHCDLQKSRELFEQALQELGLTREQFPTITILYFEGPLWNHLSAAIKEQWETGLGVRCVVQPLPWDLLFNRMDSGAFHLCGTTWESWLNDPIYTLGIFRDAKDPINFSRWDNREYKKILYRAEREPCYERRGTYYLQAEELLIDEMPVIPLVAFAPQVFKRKNLSVHHSSTMVNFKWARFQM